MKTYEPERNELLVNVADQDSESMPTTRTVSEINTLIIPCATNQLVTTSGIANKQLDNEMYHYLSLHQYIHECIKPFCNQYSTNDRIKTMEKMDALTSCNVPHPPRRVVALKIFHQTFLIRVMFLTPLGGWLPSTSFFEISSFG